MTVHGDDVGAWLEDQRRHVVWNRLFEEQQQRLGALGVEPLPEPVVTPPVEAPSGLSGAFGRGVEALRRYRDREGSVTVPRGHIEALEDDTEVKLGVWLSNTKARRGKLAGEQVAALLALGVDVVPVSTAPTAGNGSRNAASGPSGAFERGVEALRRYRDREGSVTVPRGHVEVLDDGTEVRLGVWLSNTKARRAQLAPEQLVVLGELGLNWAA